MFQFSKQIHSLYALEELAQQKTVIHCLHPMVKGMGTLIYLGFILSFDRYSFVALSPYIFYPVLMMSLAEVPVHQMLRRVLLVLPFVLFAGLSNLILENQHVVTLWQFAITQGMLSFTTLIFKTVLSVLALFILMATTPFEELIQLLRGFKTPPIILGLMEMTYRYLGTLMVETQNVVTAYKLRSGGLKAVEMGHMGSLIGQLLIKSLDRAERVYAAMKCRGYGLPVGQTESRRLTFKDGLFLGCVAISCLLFRFAVVA